ncbi:MAG: hypothetical protein IPO26_19230 [Saprospiraceae bacterium]|nr:hypothetical protein [Saprospiraceae bacterium]
MATNGHEELVRSWTFEDASGNKSYCTQRFAFEPISVTDLIPPVREVHLTCGLMQHQQQLQDI